MTRFRKIPVASGGVDAFDSAYLAAIVTSSDDAIIGKDLSGIIRSWNRGAELIFGYRAEEVVGGPVDVLVPPDRLLEEGMILARIRAGESVDHHETVRRRKDGSDFPVSVTISPIRDAEGTIVGASKILRDISERHRAQMEILKTKAELEQMVQERTAALAQRNLLLREVYHRVKNNLQVVDGLLMLESLKTEDPAARQGLGEVRARVFALGLVHQQLMGSSNLKTFDVSPFLRELTANILEGAPDRRTKLTVSASPLDVGVDFAVPLGLLVTELVTNAFKHAFPEGGGEVFVTLHPNQRHEVVLTVSDNGQGPPQATPASRKAGLGSSIVRSLVAQLGGEMVARHQVGTTIEMTFPLPETT